jgi:SAM-dependent methyltransferase
VVRPRGVEPFRAFIASGLAETLVREGKLAAHRELGRDETLARVADLAVEIEQGGIVLEHDPIPFLSSPAEWSPGMLRAAAKLTLELAQRSAPSGLWVKDATPFNVAFTGPSPVFLDYLSIEPRPAGTPFWPAYGQFVRTFALPLLAATRLGVDLRRVFTVSREGLSIEEFLKMSPKLDRLRSPERSLATFPALLTRFSPKSTQLPTRTLEPERSRFVLEGLYRHLDRTLSAIEELEPASVWTDYVHEHSREYSSAKMQLLREILTGARPRDVLDIGCNTGEVSLAASDAGARVISIDSDPAVVERLYRRSRDERRDILPLVVDITEPTPATGWNYQEHTSFLHRATGHFDAVLLLAVMHHIMVGAGVPLDDLLALAARLTRKLVVIEYVPPDDAKFRSVARGRDHLYTWLNRERFEEACTVCFECVRREDLPGGRALYVLRRRS